MTFDSAGGRTVLADVGATAVAHKNGRTLAGFSTGAKKKMLEDGYGKRELPGTTDFMKFNDYYGVDDYADHWVTAALDDENRVHGPGVEHRLLRRRRRHARAGRRSRRARRT